MKPALDDDPVGRKADPKSVPEELAGAEVRYPAGSKKDTY
jgi:hypothetical protein